MMSYVVDDIYACDLSAFVQRVAQSIDFSDVISAMKTFERAYWDYIDNSSRQNARLFPYMKINQLLEHVLLACGHEEDNIAEVARNFIRQYEKYKKSLPTAGCILLYKDMIAVVKIKGSHIFSMPKGKQDAGESLLETAIREVREETGVDLEDVLVEDTPYENILKTLFYVVELDYPVKFSHYNRNEVSSVTWVKLTAIIAEPDRYSKQTVACAEYVMYNKN